MHPTYLGKDYDRFHRNGQNFFLNHMINVAGSLGSQWHFCVPSLAVCKVSRWVLPLLKECLHPFFVLLVAPEILGRKLHFCQSDLCFFPRSNSILQTKKPNRMSYNVHNVCAPNRPPILFFIFFLLIFGVLLWKYFSFCVNTGCHIMSTMFLRF